MTLSSSPSTSATEPIRLFIGSSPSNKVEEAVFRYTLRQHASRPLEIYAIDGSTGSATNVDTKEVKQLPNELVSSIPGATDFSLARWAIPEWCSYQGRAIYCDSDQIVFADIAELWDYDLEDNTLGAVLFETAKSKPHYKSTMRSFLRDRGDCYLPSVMLIDCEKAKTWSLASIVEWIDRRKRSGQVLDVMQVGRDFRDYFDVGVKALPPEWNHLDYLERGTKLLHFTDLSSQPWEFHHHAMSSLWEKLYLATLEAGMLSMETVKQVRKDGYISRRIEALGALPAMVRSPINHAWRLWSASIFHINQFIGHQLGALSSVGRKVGRKVRSLLKRPINV